MATEQLIVPVHDWITALPVGGLLHHTQRDMVFRILGRRTAEGALEVEDSEAGTNVLTRYESLGSYGPRYDLVCQPVGSHDLYTHAEYAVNKVSHENVQVAGWHTLHDGSVLEVITPPRPYVRADLQTAFDALWDALQDAQVEAQRTQGVATQRLFRGLMDNILFARDPNMQDMQVPRRIENAWFWQSLTLDGDKIQYAQSREQVDNPKNRRSARLSTFLEMLDRKYGTHHTDGGIERASHAWSAALDIASLHVEVWVGEDAARAYRDGPNSCMRNCDSPQFYAANPHKVAMVVVHNGTYNEQSGRAVLWNTDQGELVLDRVYHGGRRAIEGLYRKVAEEYGWSSRWSRDDDPLTVTLRRHMVTCGPRCNRNGCPGNGRSVPHLPYRDTFSYQRHYKGKTVVVAHNSGAFPKLPVSKSTHIMATVEDPTYPPDFVPTLEQPFPEDGAARSIWQRVEEEAEAIAEAVTIPAIAVQMEEVLV